MVLSSLNSISSMTYYCIDMLGHNIIELFRTVQDQMTIVYEMFAKMIAGSESMDFLVRWVSSIYRTNGSNNCEWWWSHRPWHITSMRDCDFLHHWRVARRAPIICDQIIVEKISWWPSNLIKYLWNYYI
jgi:hypothetical protein